MKRFIAFLLAGMMVLSVGACSGAVTEKESAKTENSEKESAETESSETENTEVEISEYNHELTLDFAARLLQNSMKSGENTLISPISVLSVLAMTANGANGETLKQMESAFGLSMDALNQEMGAYASYIRNYKWCKVHMANSIWYKESFVTEMNINYDAKIYPVAFDDTTVKDINNWVKENTDGMIDGILNEIPDNVILFLINAISFDANWGTTYHESAISVNKFTKEDGTKRETEFMYSEEDTYLKSDNATGVMKYYKGGEYAFVALLPNEGITIDEYVASLDGESLQKMLNSATYAAVKTKIPKFEVEYDVTLNDALKQMGIVDALDNTKADFSGFGVIADGNIYISQVMHKTFICVDENGTKAGAVTGEMAATDSAPPETQAEVYLDRPFVYMIIDTTTCKPLFVGTLMDVNQ